MRFCFVILHYLAEETTSKCIDTLMESTAASDIEVIVVDNASPDGSGPALKDKYRDVSRVHFVLLERNSGFAKGNNAGYRYACDNFNPDFVVVMNNDVFIDDKNFVDKVEREYKKDSFAVLGPDIFSPDAEVHQSPARLSPMSLEEAVGLKDKLVKRSHCFYFNYLKWQLKLLLKLASKPHQCESSYDIPHKNCVLHGACYIFSREFSDKRKYAFNPGTFLYLEEDILAVECVLAGLTIRYAPDIKVTHMEDVSTKSAYNFQIKREKMKNRYMAESINVLISVLSK